MSSPVNHSTELVADLREEPGTDHVTDVAIRLPSAASFELFVGPREPGSSASMPGRGFFSMASVQRMSGRPGVGAGDRSSVLVSPVTLNTVSFARPALPDARWNHSASAQLCITALALALPLWRARQRRGSSRTPAASSSGLRRRRRRRRHRPAGRSAA